MPPARIRRGGWPATERKANAVKKEETITAQRTGFSRRNFLMGTFAGGAAAATAMAGLSGCSAEDDDTSLGGIQKSMGYITHMAKICTGCRTCELICALTHEKVINPLLSRNHVVTDIQAGHVTEVRYCQQCDDPKCMHACHAGALHVDPETGARVIDQDKCTGCQKCMNACIFAQAGGESRIRYNAATNTCFKCDLCGGEPKCVQYCPLGASMASWIDYPEIIRPGIDDYVELTTEGAIEGITFEKDYSGAHAGKAQDEKPWAMVATDTGVKVVGQVTSSDGAELRVRIKAEFYDANGHLIDESVEHQYCMTMHEHMPIELEWDTADYSAVTTVVLVANIGYWVAGVDEEY